MMHLQANVADCHQGIEAGILPSQQSSILQGSGQVILVVKGTAGGDGIHDSGQVGQF